MGKSGCSAIQFNDLCNSSAAENESMCWYNGKAQGKINFADVFIPFIVLFYSHATGWILLPIF